MDTLRNLLCGLLAAAALCAPALALPPQDTDAGGGVSGSHFFATSSDFLINQTTSFTQYEPSIAMRPDGQLVVVAWASAAGGDVYARVFNGVGVPLTNQIQCDTTFTAGTQDEPSVAVDDGGHFMVAWSDRQGNDGFDMGVFARIFNPNGTPIGPDFQVNVTAQQSQWEPFIAARPNNGGWVVGWSGTDGSKTYMRLYTVNGVPQTGEIEVAQFNAKQIDPVPAVWRDGSMFFTWVDFNGKGGAGNGTSVFGRYFDASGTPVGGEFQVNTTNPGDQREARLAADGIGRCVVVWEDHQTDANATDIHARRYSKLGFPLSAEWEVNTTKGADQLKPQVACDWVGNFTVVWEDRSAGLGFGDVRAQRFNSQGQPLGTEFVVNSMLAGDQTMPDVAVDWAGEWFQFGFATLGTTLDVDARRFRFTPLTQIGPAKTGQTFGMELDLPGSVNLYRYVLMSTGFNPGIPLPDGRKLELNYDVLFGALLPDPSAGGAFTGVVGPMPADATDLATFILPPNPALVGMTLQVAAITLDLGQPGLANQLRHVTNHLAIAVQ